MTQIDEPNLDEQIRSALRIAKHIAETGGDGLEERQVDEIKALIATQVREAVKEEKSLRAKLVTKAHKDGIADGLQMALYGVKDGSKEEKFIRHLLYSENIGDKE